MEEEEFSKLYWHLHERLTPFAILRLGYNDAQDVVAETLSAVWQKNFSAPTTDEEMLVIFSFAFTTLRNKISNVYRFRDRHPELTSEWKDSFAPTTEPHTVFEKYADAFAFLRQLKENDQIILLLRYIGYPTKNIAVLLNCSEEAARQRLSRATRRAQDLRLKQNREENNDEKRPN